MTSDKPCCIRQALCPNIGTAPVPVSTFPPCGPVPLCQQGRERKRVEPMFGILGDLAKAAAAVVTVPVAVVADVVTMGGVLNDKKETYTAEAVGDFVDNLKNATEPRK